MMDLDRAIRNELDRSATLVPIHPDPTRAVRRARQRQRRRSVAAGLATAVAVTAVGVGAATLLPSDEAVLSAANQPNWAEIEWELHESDLPAPGRVVQGPDDVLYLLSTAPGARYDPGADTPPDRALYRSVDGTTWEATVLADGPDLAIVEGTSDLLYGISTAPGDDDRAADRPYVSADRGETWRELDALPEPQVLPEEERVGLLADPWISLDVLAGDDVVALVRTTDYAVDFEALQRELGYGDDIVIGVDGDTYTVSVYDEVPAVPAGGSDVEQPVEEATTETTEYAVDQGTVKETGSLADLGFSAPRVEVELFVPDGADGWVAADPGPVDQVFVMGGDLVAVTMPTDPFGVTEIRRSSDGITWTPLAGPNGGLTVLGATADLVIGTVSGGNGFALTAGDATGAWTETPLGAIEPELATVGYVEGAVGGLGAVLWTTTENGEQWVLISSDGTTWQATPAEALGLGPEQWIRSAFVTADHIGLFIAERSTDPGITPSTTGILLGTPRR